MGSYVIVVLSWLQGVRRSQEGLNKSTRQSKAWHVSGLIGEIAVNMGTSISTIREDTITADRETRLEIEERLKLLEKMVRSQLEEEYLSVVAEDSGIHTGMVVDVLKKVNIVMSSRCTDKVEDIIDSFFSEVMLKGFDTLIKFSISEIVDKTSVGEHSIRHIIVLPTNTSILRCDVYYYRWNFASKGIIDNMEGVVGVLLLKRVIDVVKSDQKVLDRALSHTMSWTLDGDEPTEEDLIARIILYDLL